MTSSLVIMTCGTSLLQRREESDELFFDLNRACGDLVQVVSKRNGPLEDLESCESSVLQALLRLDESQQVARRSQMGRRDYLPQELSYLYLLLTEGLLTSDTVAVRLLASNSRLGEACAQVICDYIKDRSDNGKNPWKRIDTISYEVVDGLQTEDAKVFRKHGAPNLIKRICELAGERSYTSEAPVIINPTGGFKELIPYATIATAFIDRPFVMHYLFQDSPSIIELPAYPIGLDFPLWHRQESIRQGAAFWNGYRSHLDFRMKSVVPSTGPSEGATSIFEAAYNRQAEVDAFQHFSEKVVGDLLTENDYRERLLAVLGQVGPNIWLGDKVPMAASHAAQHHHHLLETAQLLLLPMIQADDDFLNQEEFFVLLAGLILHDCGHSIDALPSERGSLVRLFPSEIRDLHNFLSFYRLRTPALAEGLSWDPCKPLADEVAYLCLYHRVRTGWLNVKSEFGRGYCPYLDMRIVSPTQAQDEYGLCRHIDFPKLVLLLRLIDGCDNQTRRVGPPPRIRALDHLWQQERCVFESQYRQATEAAAEHAGNKQLVGREFIDNSVKWFGKQDGAPPEFERAHREEIAVCKDIDPVWARLWTEAARARDELAVRNRQLFHFLKHQVVRRIIIHPTEEFDAESCWAFAITLVEDTDLRVPEYCGSVLDHQHFAADYQKQLGGETSLRQWLLDELASEIGEPSTGASPQTEYLATAVGRSVSFEFRWSDDRSASRRFCATP